MGRILLAAAMVLAVGTRSLPAGGDGAFSLRNSLEIILGGNPDALAAGDFDRDGRLDLAATNLSGHFEIVLQDSRDREVWKRLPAEQAIGGYFLRPADFDGDGDDDLIVAVLADAAFFLRSGGDGSFAPAARVAGSLEPRWITLGDFDRDGALDVA